MPPAPRYALGLPEPQRSAAAALYLEAFGQKLGPIIGRDRRARDFLAGVLRPSHALVALDEDDALLGLAGFHDESGGFVGGGAPELLAAFGPFSGLFRGFLLSLFERAPKPGEFLMDGIAVAPAARGMGIGGALIERLATLAAERGALHLRLEVVDSNPRARALYERHGFTAGGTTGSALLQPIFGFSRATTMLRAVALTGR